MRSSRPGVSENTLLLSYYIYIMYLSATNVCLSVDIFYTDIRPDTIMQHTIIISIIIQAMLV